MKRGRMGKTVAEKLIAASLVDGEMIKSARRDLQLPGERHLPSAPPGAVRKTGQQSSEKRFPHAERRRRMTEILGTLRADYRATAEW